MDKNQNLQYIVEDVEALWPKINRPYRFDNKEKRSVPCDATDDQAKYEIDFRMNKGQARDLWKAMSGAYTNQKQESWPEKIKNPFKKDEENDTFTFKSKLAAAYNGEATPAPAQYDAKNKQLDGSFELTTGSTVNVAVVFVPYSIDKERTGVSLRLKGVQVTNYVPRKSISPFKAVDGFTSDDPSDDNPFEEVVADTASEEEDILEVEEPKKMSKKSAAPKEEKPEIAEVLSEWDD